MTVINVVAPLFFAVDIATGAITRYKPLGYDIELEPEEQAHQLDTLQQDDQGRYLVPMQKGQVMVNDPAKGFSLVFHQ